MNKPAMTSNGRHRRLLTLVVVLVLLGGLAWFVNTQLTMDELVRQEARLRDFIAANPGRAFWYGFGVYFTLSLVPGTGGKGIVYGWLFGFWQAVTIVTVGLALAGMIIFYLARYLFQAGIERRYARLVSQVNRHLEKEGAFYLLAMRMAHVPYSIVNPVSGASRVRAWTFCWTTVIGLLPANMIWVYVGINLPSLEELAARGTEAFLSLPLLLALIGCGILPLLIRWLVSRWIVPASELPASEDISTTGNRTSP